MVERNLYIQLINIVKKIQEKKIAERKKNAKFSKILVEKM